MLASYGLLVFQQSKVFIYLFLGAYSLLFLETFLVFLIKENFYRPIQITNVKERGEEEPIINVVIP